MSRISGRFIVKTYFVEELFYALQPHTDRINSYFALPVYDDSVEIHELDVKMVIPQSQWRKLKSYKSFEMVGSQVVHQNDKDFYLMRSNPILWENILLFYQKNDITLTFNGYYNDRWQIHFFGTTKEKVMQLLPKGTNIEFREMFLKKIEKYGEFRQ